MATQETITHTAPQVGVPSAGSKWQSEFEAFERLLPGLLQSHMGQYVVIHNGQVADSGPDDLALALRFFAQHGKVPVHIGLVTSEPQQAIRVPHYRTTTMKETP
jgi:hypothetical protein